MGDAADDAFENAAVAGAELGIVERAEAEGIEHGNGPGAHGEDVAENAADAGGRALEGFDEAGMIVALDFESDTEAVTDIDDTGVFTGAEEDLFAARGELFQMNARAFVGAVFAPHDAEDAELGKVRLAVKDGENLGVLIRSHIVGGEYVRGDGGHGLFCGEGGEHGTENGEAVGGTHQRISGAFRVGHHTKHVAFPITDAGDVAEGAVGIIDVTEYHAIFGFEFIKRGFIGGVAALAVSDGEGEDLAFGGLIGERGIGGFDF